MARGVWDRYNAVGYPCHSTAEVTGVCRPVQKVGWVVLNGIVATTYPSRVRWGGRRVGVPGWAHNSCSGNQPRSHSVPGGASVFYGNLMAQVGFGRTPLALIAEGSESVVRSLEHLLVANGYAVLKAYSARQSDRLLRRIRPDLVLVGLDLPDIDGIDYVAMLRRESGLRDSTPVLLVTSGTLSADARARAFSSGCWGMIPIPLNEAEVVPQLESLVRAKQDADTAREASLVDPDTGLYNVRGILRRVAEATADSERHGRPVTCVALGLEGIEEDSGVDRQSLSEEFAARLASAIRGADTAGRIGDADFIVLAPGTTPEGASLLAKRLLRSVEPVAAARVEVRVGYSTFESAHETGGFIPVDLLTRATLALRKAQEPEGERIQPYEA